jgi:teichuronic acid exporter
MEPNLTTAVFGRSIGASIVRGAFWTTIDKWGSRIIRLLVLAVLARLLDKADFGLIAAASVVVDYLSTYVAQGLGLAVIQREKLEPGHLNAMFWINMASAIFLVGLIWIFAPYMSIWIHTPETTSVLRWLSLGLILEALSRVQTALLTREMRFSALAAVNFVSAFVGGSIGLIFAFRGWGVWSLVAQYLTGSISARIALWWFSGWRPGLSFNLKHVRDLYGFSLYVFADQQLVFILRRFDEALIAGYLGVSDLGLYSIAKRLVLLLQEALETPLGQVLTPAYSRVQSSLQKLLNVVRRTFSMLMAIGIPTFLGLVAMAPEAINVVFGPRWIEASAATRLLAFGAAASMTNIAIYPVFLAIGKPQVLLSINIASVIFGVPLLFVGVKYGAPGAAIAVTFRQIIMAIASFVVLKKMIAMKVEIGIARAIAIPAFGGILCGFAARMAANALSPLSTWISICLPVLIASGIYIGLLKMLNPSLAQEFYRSTRELYRMVLK